MSESPALTSMASTRGIRGHSAALARVLPLGKRQSSTSWFDAGDRVVWSSTCECTGARPASSALGSTRRHRVRDGLMVHSKLYMTSRRPSKPWGCGIAMSGRTLN